MALESLSDTPPPLVSKGNNESDIPANNSLSVIAEQERDTTTEGEKTDPPADELEDGEIDDDEEEEAEEEELTEKEESEDDVDVEEKRRIKKRQKNKERRKRKKEEKRMQALQAWAMAMAAGEMGDQGEIVEEDEEMPSEEEEEAKEDNTPVAKTAERKPSPRKKKQQQQQQQRKRQRAPSPSDSDEEYTKLLKKEMSRHRLKRKSSGESSSEDRRGGGGGRSQGMFDSGGDAPLNHEEEASEGEEVESSHRSKKKKRKKHKHHRTKHAPKKSRREQQMESDEEDRMLPHPHHHHHHHHNQQQQQLHHDQQYMQQQQQQQQQHPPMSEQEQQIMMDQSMGKVHVPKTHLICKFYLENKCKKGLDCSYTHEGSIPKRLEQCKFYLQGFCSKGPLCMFLHQEYPCKYYHTGQICYSEEKCRFSHAPLTEELKSLVDMMRQEMMGPKMRDRENDQPPLLPSPEKQPNVPFQRGNSGGKPPHPQKGGSKSNNNNSSSSSNSIPSLFDIKVKPVGEKGQIILEKERKGLLGFDDGPPSFYNAEQEEHMQGNHHGGPSNQRDGPHGHARPPMGSPRQQGQQGPSHHGHSHGEPSSAPSRQQQNNDPPEQSSRPPPLLPTPSSPMHPGPSTAPQNHHQEDPAPPPSLLMDPRKRPPPEEDRAPPASSQENPEPAVPRDDTLASSERPPLPGIRESPSHPSHPPAMEDGVPSEKAGSESGEAASGKPVVEPPKSMPAKSKALFMRIQQNQLKSEEGEEEADKTQSQQKETDPEDNWYSSDEEEGGGKKSQSEGGIGAESPKLRIRTENPTVIIPAPSAISPEASNRGPLLSSVLIANNKQNQAQSAQTQLPGALASLFSGSQNPPGSAPNSTAAAPNSKAAPLPLNILDLVTKGTSSVQKSKNPQVQDLFADILPKKNSAQSEYRLLECIRDPNLKDPREGRERRSKVGMMLRVLKWKQSEYTVSDPDERPSLPPIELTTPTELKPPPIFPTETDARTQAMMDAIKKVISEVRGKPADPRNQRPPHPRMPPLDPRGFPNDSRAGNFPPPPPVPMDGRNNVRPPYSMPGQQSPRHPGPPRQQGPPPQRPPGPGFARHPIGQPSQSFPPRMLRPPRPPQQQVPTGYSNPRFANAGPRGPRPMRPELGQRMPHRPNRPPPLLQPPFGSPPRGGPQQHERMPGPRGPRFGNPRMAEIPPLEPLRMEGSRDPRAAARAGAVDPRLAKRGVPQAASSDVDMRVSKDPRLSRMQEQSNFSGGPVVPSGFGVSQGSGDVDMRQLNSPPPPAALSTYNKEKPSETPPPPRSSLDPRQAARIVNPSNDVDLRPKRPSVDERGGPGEESGGMPLKDMFKGRDPTASPFV